MRWLIEVVQVPVADVDLAIAFYRDQVGFALDHDTTVPGGPRFAQLTPPGSGCSIVVGFPAMSPGSQQGLQLVVADVVAAQSQLAAAGVEVSGVEVFGPSGPRPYEPGDELENVGFCHFRDPDGNGWSVQQISARGA